MKRRNKRPHRAPDPAALAPQAIGPDPVLHSRVIGALPIVNRMLERCRLREILGRHLPLYPESRPCRRPTTRRVIDVMESLCRHRRTAADATTQDLYTDPTPIQRQLMKRCGISPASYGRPG